MTSTKTLSAEKSGGVRRYFRFTVKQNVQHFALYLILALCAMALPAFLMIQDYLALDHATMNMRQILVRTEEIVNTNAMLAIAYSVLIAVLAGMSAMAYVNDKTAVGCYHSFPIRRESVFLTETLTRALYYLVSYLIGSGVSFLMMSMTLKELPSFSAVWFRMIVSGALVFCLTYSVILLAGGLCGTNLMKFLMTGVILFLPLILYVLIVFMLDLAIPNLYESYYTSRPFLEKFSPVWDAAYRVQDVFDGNGFPVWTLLPESLIFYAGALLLHKYRRSEDSGVTIIWKPLLKIVKYLLIFAAALLGAAVFYAGLFTGSGSHPFKMFLGAYVFAFLAFLVSNCLLYRSARAMFRDLKPFAVFLAGLTAFLILVPMNVTGLIGKPYSVKATKSVQVQLGSGNNDPVVYTDPETVEWLIPILEPRKAEDPVYTETVEYYLVQNLYGENLPSQMLKRYSSEKNIVYAEYESGYRDAVYEPELFKPILESDTVNVVLIQYPKFGFPLAVADWLDGSGRLMDRLCATEEYRNMRNSRADMDVEDMTFFQVSLFQYSVVMEPNIDSYSVQDEVRATRESYSHERTLTPEMRAAAAEMLAMYRYDPAKRLTVPQIGWMEIIDRTNEYVRRIFPIYADDAELIAAAAKILGLENPASVEGVYAAAAESIRDAVLVNAKTGEGRMLPSDLTESFLDKTVSLSFEENWTLRAERKCAPSKYQILVSYSLYPNTSAYNDSFMELQFRADAIAETELDALFASLK